MGLVNAAQFVPYAVLGLIAGVCVDRWRRKPVLVVSSLGRALCLAAIPLLWLLSALSSWVLAVLLVGYGSFAVFGFAATQSILPSLVERRDLVKANSRLDQSDTAAQTLGPVVGGGLVAGLGAPLAIAVDAVSYLVDAILNAGLKVEEPRRVAEGRPRLVARVREGIAWTYRHATLGPLLGRVNGTRRSVNRTVAVLGSALGGVVLAWLGERVTLIAVVVVFAVATLVALGSPLRRQDLAWEDDEPAG